MIKEQTAQTHTGILSRFWKRFVSTPIKKQLTQGTSIEKISLSMAISPVISAFPVLGTTNLLSILAGSILRLNLPFLLLFKSLFYPLHIALILVFIRIGESINGAPHISFSLPELLAKFKDDPMQFVRDFGMTALYGIEAWALIAPWFAIPLYFTFRCLIKTYMGRKSDHVEAI